MSDPGKYRTREEVEKMMEFDPILAFAKHLREKHSLAEADLGALDTDVQAQVADAVRYAEQSPIPSPESLYEDVYVKSPYIYGPAADKDPAWRAAVPHDRIPERLAAWGSPKVEG
jgi:pyruvate dehydrogenase E1 component alpha subunit